MERRGGGDDSPAQQRGGPPSYIAGGTASASAGRLPAGLVTSTPAVIAPRHGSVPTRRMTIAHGAHLVPYMHMSLLWFASLLSSGRGRRPCQPPPKKA